MTSITSYCYLAIAIAAVAFADYKMHGMAPQGTQLLIECEFGNITSIISADYGAHNCSSKDAKGKVESLCLGLPICSIRVDDATLGGEPCSTQHKDLIVEALCSGNRQMENITKPQKTLSASRNAPSKDNLDSKPQDDLTSPSSTDSKSASGVDTTSSPKSNFKSSSEDAPELEPPENSPEPQPRSSPESLSFGMLQRLVSLDGLKMSDGDIAGAFHDCDHDNDNRISGPELDDLIARLQKRRRSIPIKATKSQGGKAPGVGNPGTLNDTTPDDGSDEKLDKLINTLSNLSDDLEELLNKNSTLPPKPRNSTDDDRRKQMEFKNHLMTPTETPAPAPSPTTAPASTLMDPWKSWGFTPAPPKDQSTIEATISFQIANSSDKNINGTFSTRSVVYIPTGQSRKLLCSGIISDAWFSTYWWPDSPATEHIREEPECKEEESIALDTLKQMCLQKPDCTVTAPATTLSEKCPLSLKYVTVAYKCSIPSKDLPV